MKKTTLAALAILAVAFVAVPTLRAGHGNDFQAIQKAVKQNPSYEKGKEVTLFKLLITDTKSGKEEVRITLPISLVEALINCADGKHMRFHDEGCDIDLKALWADLKKAGPMSLIEIKDEDALIKVWLE
jgi:hypothetical protein